ncbi:MAG: hypothetical protein L6R36_004456 [Xanthoria steineri]|nr:MAG: hypothetical protein L6R36_004456 [Xanthoria steineri]
MVREEIAHEIIILIASPRAIKHLAQTRVWESNRAFFTRLDLRTSVCCRWHPPCQPGHPKHIVAYSGKVRYQGPSTVDTAVLDGYAASRPRMGTIWPRKKYLLGHREDFEVLPEQQREDNTAGQLNVARHSLGALLAEKFAAEGCNLAINYNASEDRAQQVAQKIRNTYNCKAILVKGVPAPSSDASSYQLTKPSQDQGVLAECENTVQESIDRLGGLDILVSNAGWTKMSTFANLDTLSEEDWDKCWAVNCKGNLHLFRKALPTFNANPEGGVFLLTSSIAGVGPQGSAMAYSVSKAAGLQLMKCLAATQGPKVRINAICPGLLLTDWGQTFSPERIQASKDKAVLKQETDLNDCADLFVAVAKNSSMTGQSIVVDSGLSDIH